MKEIETAEYNMRYKYTGSVTKLPTNSKFGDIVVCDNKIYVYHNDWEELYALFDENKDSEIREAIKGAEDCSLKTKLLQIFKKYDEREQIDL